MEENNIEEKLKRLNLDSDLITLLEDQIRTLEDRIKLLEIENKQLKNDSHSQASDIQTAMLKLQLSLKPRFVRLDDLVCNSGLVHVAYKIFGYLDLKSLRNCRLVSKAWKDCIEDDSSYWRRLLDAAKSHTLLNVFPEFVEVFDYLQSKSSIDDIKLFIDFMVEIFATEGRGFGDVPLHHAIVEKKLDVLKRIFIQCIRNGMYSKFVQAETEINFACAKRWPSASGPQLLVKPSGKFSVCKTRK